jgi:hypothetical protein
VNRAQSETVGFVLVFALITASTGIVYVGGFTSLEDARTAEEIDNAERAFDVLDENMADVARRGAPSRATELSLGNGDIALGNRTTITINTTYAANGSAAANTSVGVRPIVYRLDGTEIAYTSGAVLRSDRGAATVQTAPEWIVSADRTVVPLVVTVPDPDGRGGVGGDVTILVRSERLSRALPVELDPAGSALDVTVTVESDRAEAWNQFLDGRGLVPIDGNPADGQITYRLTTDELYVQRTSIRVGFKQ